MNDEIARAIEDLTVWRTSYVRILTAKSTESGVPRLGFGGVTDPVIKFPELTKASDYEIRGRAEFEPELREAMAALNKAIDGVHEARNRIIERKAQELASLVHGAQIQRIQDAVSAITGNR